MLILCGKTTTWGIFVSKRPKTHMPLQNKCLLLFVSANYRIENIFEKGIIFYF